MTDSVQSGEFVANLFARRAVDGNVFRLDDGDLAVFDPALAKRLNAENFADLTMGDSLADTLLGREGCPVAWGSVRSKWLASLRTFSRPENHQAMSARMASVIEARLGVTTNLSWLGQEIITRPLVPVIIDGLRPSAARSVHSDLIWKITHLMRTVEPVRRREPIWYARGLVLGQARAGLAIRAELRGRVKGTRPNREDLAQSLVEDWARLGPDRAVDALTTVLTAVAGPPGAAGACLMRELVNQTAWLPRLRDELSAVDEHEFMTAPAGVAPLTARFVKEVLRMWSPPLLLTRVAVKDMPVPGGTLHAGQQYLLSPYMIHHDPTVWPDPDTFDPDRWLPASPSGPLTSTHYIPFGWAPTSCIGAGLGMTQLMLLCRLLCTRFEVVSEGVAPMMLAAVPLPRGFIGAIQRR